MAGHWIKWEKGLVRKPEIILIAKALKSTTLHAAGCCMMVWEWAEDATRDGFVAGLSAADVSLAAGLPGIGEAMRDAGWLLEEREGIVFPNWDRNNSDPAKQRALRAFYMRVYRNEKKQAELRARGRVNNM